MSTATDLGIAATTHGELLAWVRETVEITRPDRVQWCEGSSEEWTQITELLVESGTFTRLNPAIKPNSFWAASDHSDVARVEHQTFICSLQEKDAGPTNNWMNPEHMKAHLGGRFAGSITGRTLYVIPYCMGPLTASEPKLGVQITIRPTSSPPCTS
jgi:phosphoenolpyruvate carboxykinase (GTP)